MKIFTYSEARQNLSRLLTIAQDEEVEIRRRDGSVFSVTRKAPALTSPFDVAGVSSGATTENILEAVRTSRAR